MISETNFDMVFGPWVLQCFYGSDNFRQSPSLTLYRKVLRKCNLQEIGEYFSSDENPTKEQKLNKIEEVGEIWHGKCSIRMTLDDPEFAPMLVRIFAEKEKERDGQTPDYP